MRLKTYTATTASEALQLIRDELGESAVIVLTETDRDAGTTVITAALDERMEATEQPSPASTETVLNDLSDASATLRQVLGRHGVPPHLGARLVTAGSPAADRNITDDIERGLRALYRFEPLDETIGSRPVMLAGPPGVGKTVTAAKIAARAVMAGTTPIVATTDTVRAGAIGQLEAFTRILKIDLITVRNIADLEDARAAASGSPLLIDTAGANPFDDDALDTIGGTANAIGAEPILVLAGGGDAVEAAEIAAAFSRIQCQRLIATRIDLTRRLGSLLAAADSGRLAFSDASITPEIANGLNPLEPRMLAELLSAATTRPND